MTHTAEKGETHLKVPLWINGKEQLGESIFDVISPHTSQTCWQVAGAGAKETQQAIEAAQAAFPSWSQTKPGQRSAILLRAADLIEENVDTFAEYMRTEMGCEMFLGRDAHIPLAIQLLRDIAARATTISHSAPICQEGTSCIVFKEPYGVILGIAPWNAPYIFAVRSAATAIATGNTTILKGSELSPRCYWSMGKIFADAGLPAGVLNILYCPPADAPAIVSSMIEHPAIRKINFTGSTNTGRQIAKVCGQNLKPCLMELGGKNSAIILPDADLDKAAKECISGAFLNSGQVCMGTDRIIIHSAIASEFLATLKSNLLAESDSSNPIPKVISSASKSRLKSLVDKALSEGVEVFHGSPEDSKKDSGLDTEFSPIIFGGIKEDMDIWNDELFGPLAAYTIVTSEDEAVRVANSSDYGLSAAVFTRDLRKGLEIAKRLESGAVHINSMTIHDEPTLPHGGVKNSGWGRFNAARGMEEFLVTKTVTWDD